VTATATKRARFTDYWPSCIDGAPR